MTHDRQTTKGIQFMFSGRVTRFITIGAAAVAIAGGAYGVVSATATAARIALCRSQRAKLSSRESAQAATRPL
jgi:hypothetical protein